MWFWNHKQEWTSVACGSEAWKTAMAKWTNENSYQISFLYIQMCVCVCVWSQCAFVILNFSLRPALVFRLKDDEMYDDLQAMRHVRNNMHSIYTSQKTDGVFFLVCSRDYQYKQRNSRTRKSEMACSFQLISPPSFFSPLFLSLYFVNTQSVFFYLLVLLQFIHSNKVTHFNKDKGFQTSIVP